MRAELLLSQVQTPGARCACVQQAAILQQQQKQQKQKLPEAPKRKEGSRNTFKQNFLTARVKSITIFIFGILTSKAIDW